ncbi:CvpA family protein [Crenothrix sp.]|uniref:CvpA family protein n=1 Tax=Crenothrix sp. TaxID=3100433 RepID=UPI00374D36B8
MLWIDNIIIAIIFICTLAGVVRGLVGEIMSLGGWMLSIGIGLSFNREFSVLLNLTVANPAVKVALSFVGLLIITSLMGNTINALLIDIIRGTNLSFFNRFWAMFLGSVHGILIVATLILLAGLSPLPSESWWNNALLIPPFQSLAIFMRDNIPSEMASYVNYH